VRPEKQLMKPAGFKITAWNYIAEFFEPGFVKILRIDG
jgi:hypothetical protein